MSNERPETRAGEDPAAPGAGEVQAAPGAGEVQAAPGAGEVQAAVGAGAGQTVRWPKTCREWAWFAVKAAALVVALLAFVLSLTNVLDHKGSAALFAGIAGVLLLFKECFGVLSQSRETKVLADFWDQCGAFCGLFGVALGVPVLLDAVAVAFS